MDKLFARILGILSSLIIFSSGVKAKSATDINDTYLDTNSNTHINEIKLIPRPRPLILKQTDFTFDETFAGHRSHSSHRSHASHVSHRSGSYAPSPSSPAIPEKSPTTPEKSLPSPTPFLKPSEPTSKKWQSTTEWRENSCKLYHHDVIVTFKDNSSLEGVVTECKGNAIEVTESGSEDTKRQHRIDLNNIENLLWR